MVAPGAGRVERSTTAPISVIPMNREFTPLRATELDATNFLEWRDRILSFESNPAATEPRTYPGYPRWPLLRVAARPWPPLDRSLMRRRSATTFSTGMPSKRVLSRLLCSVVPGSWHLRGSRAWPGSIGGWQAITRTLRCNLRAIVAALRRLPFRPRRKLPLPNRFIRQPP